MDSVTNPQDDPTDLPETAEVRLRRLAREADMTAEARAQIAAGEGRTGRDLDDWLDAWAGDGALKPRRPTPQ